MSRYPIKLEFFPFMLIKPPLKDAQTASKIGEMMKPPRWIWNDKDISVKSERINGYNDDTIEILIIEPKNKPTDNALVYYHGGGFLFEGTDYHYRNAKAYALRVPCKVIFVQYRLGVKNPYPIPHEDSYEALRWTINNADMLKINKEKIAVGGDSAGGCLAAAVTQMARDRELGANIRFQLLIYPFLDQSLESESNRRFTDTPMWNSTLSRRMSEDPKKINDSRPEKYASPIMDPCVRLPKAYIETAEFDSLHDDGINYAKKLMSHGINVELNETKGTMHIFDMVQYAKTTKAAVSARVAYMKKEFDPFCGIND